MLIQLKKAQSTLEYAGLIATVVAAIITMQIFVKNSLSNKQKTSAESISEEAFNPMHTTLSETTRLPEGQVRTETQKREYTGVTTSKSFGVTDGQGAQTTFTSTRTTDYSEGNFVK